MTSRPSTAAPILAVLAIVLVTLGAYVGGYLALGTVVEVSRGLTVRVYDAEWQVTLFSPAAKFEKQITGRTIWVMTPVR